MLRSRFSIGRSRSGRVRSNSENWRATACASAVPTALKRKRASRRCLRKPSEIGGDHGCDFWVTARGVAVRHQRDRLAIAGHLQAPVHCAVGDDVVAVQVLEEGSFEPISHTIAGCRYLPFAVDKELLDVVGEFVVLRTPDHADRRIGCRRQFDALLSRAACGCCFQFVSSLQWTRIGLPRPARG